MVARLMRPFAGLFSVLALAFVALAPTIAPAQVTGGIIAPAIQGTLGKWRVDASGNITAVTDNANDIGASGANRPRNAYIAQNINIGGASEYQFSGRTNVSSSADGNLTLLNNARTSFGLLQFGGTTSSFPAIKRNAATFDFRLADDSAYAAITSGRIFATNGVNMTDGTDLFWNSRSSFAAPSDGVITLTNNAKTAFTGLLLGPSGTSYVRLKPDGVGGMSLRFADDSANGNFTTGGLTVTGGERHAVRVVTAAGAVSVALSDYTVIVNKTVAAATTVNLSAASSGFEYVIKDGKGDAATNNITIVPASGLIDGAANKVINVNFGWARIITDGTNWFTVG